MERAIGRLACRQLGLVCFKQLRELRVSPSAIQRLVGKGRLIAVHRGVYRVNGAQTTFEQLSFAGQIAAGDAVISHLSAAVIWGFEGVTTSMPEISVPEHRQPQLEGVIVHRVSNLDRRDVCRRGPLRITTPARTLVDLAGVLPAADLEDTLDDSLRRRMASLPSLRAAIERRGRRGVRGIAVLQRLINERSSDRVSGSRRENALRRLLSVARLPKPIAQYEIRDYRGRFLARVDFAYPGERIAIEYDGRHHADRSNWESDLARQNRIVNAGWRILRYCYSDLIDRPDEVIAEIRLALGADSLGRPKMG